MDDLHACLAMVAQKLQKIFAFYENNLRGVESFGCDFVRSARQCGTKAQHLTWSGHAQHQPLAVLAGDREFGATVTEDVDSLWLTTFTEESGASRVDGSGLYIVKRLERVGREIAEHAIWPQFAAEAARICDALHILLDNANKSL